MKTIVVLGAALVGLIGVSPVAQAVEFGSPDFSNFLSRPGLVSCDWTYDSYVRSCPTPDIPPKPPAAKPASAAKRKP